MYAVDVLIVESLNGLVRRDLKEHLVPALCHGQEHVPLDHAAPRPIQPGLENKHDQVLTEGLSGFNNFWQVFSGNSLFLQLQ